MRIFNTFCDYFFIYYKGEVARTSQVCLALLVLGNWQGAEVPMYAGFFWLIVFLSFFLFVFFLPSTSGGR